MLSDLGVFYCIFSVNTIPLSVLDFIFFVLVTISFFSSRALRDHSDRGARERNKGISIEFFFLFFETLRAFGFRSSCKALNQC